MQANRVETLAVSLPRADAENRPGYARQRIVVPQDQPIT